MRISLFMLLILLSGCSVAPLELTDRLNLGNPAALILDVTPPENLSLDWAPQPIQGFIVSQNADGFIGRNDYQDFAVGQMISKRVEDYIGTISRVVARSDNRVSITLESARLNYKYGWQKLFYAKLLVNVEIIVDGNSRRKIYYRQIVDQPELTASELLGLVFDEVAIEIGQDILTLLAK